MTLNFKNSTRLALACLLMLSLTVQAQFWGSKKTELLAETEAFRVTAIIDGEKLRIQWSIAQDYYMYRDQFAVSSKTAGAEFAELVFPQGVIEQDPEFGEVVVYFYNVDLSAAIKSLANTGEQIELEVLGQGCNKPIGVCYPPQTRSITVDFEPLAGDTALPTSSNTQQSQQTTGFSAAPSTDLDGGFWSYVVAAFFIGILLSFTPCVLPMIPILLAIIAGQHKPSKLGSGLLACCYVAGHVVVYAIAGWVLGKGGGQLQAHFQSPYVIGFVCGLLVVLAISLFGGFKIQLPSSLQTRLSSAKPNGRLLSITAFILGAISSLVVGACVSPLLIIAIGAAITLGDPVLGSMVMSALALGMGTLLIALGFGAGWLLPKAGAWMNHVQVILGFSVLGATIFIASFIDLIPVLYFWSALLIWLGFYFWTLATPMTTDIIKTLFRAISVVTVIWGIAALVGAQFGGKDITQPLESVRIGSANGAGISMVDNTLPFNRVTTVAEATKLLAIAKAAKQPVLVDFYADWCLDCKRMDRTTLKEQGVHVALDSWLLIKADVTDTNDNSEALKTFFDVFGPPATLFIKPNGEEHQNLRQYGYMNKNDFLVLIDQAKP
jgi:thiol:disulfide interchange protein DsbD